MGGRHELRVLPTSYLRLFERAEARFRADDRVQAMWLGGSLARGTADEASDLDLVLAVADDAFDSFASDWRGWLADITPTVLAAELPFAKGIIYSVTPGFERLDVVVERVSALVSTPHRSRILVFDKADLDGQVPDPLPGGGPSDTTVEAIITEYFRTNAVETILVRDDWLLAREHIRAVSTLIYRLLVEANAPLPATGVKQWSTKLSDEQKTLMLALPTTCDDIEGLRVAHVHLARAFVSNAAALAEQLGVVWPEQLEAAAAAHVRRHIGVEQPFPRDPTAVVVPTEPAR